MKAYLRVFVLGMILVVCCASISLAVNSVVVESGSLNKGDAGVAIRARLTNDVVLRSLAVPLVVRQVQGGAFITTLKLGYGDRLPVGSGQPLSDIPVANIYSTEDGNCKNSQPGGFGTLSSTDTSTFPVAGSPVGMLFARTRILGPNLDPGADSIGSLILTVDVNNNQGSFEIDSTCTNPANHLLYIENGTSQAFAPDFTKGVFTVGHPPVARDTAWSTNEDTPHAVSYLPADDADGDALTFSITANPLHGSLSGFNANTGAFSYTPDPDYNGPDSLGFVASDGVFLSDTGMVRITVVSVNDPPTALDTAIVTDEDTPVAARYQAFDPDTPVLTYIRVTGPFRGSITAFNPATGEFTYLPNTNYNGADSITFRVNDGDNNSNDAMVRITVNPINDPPVARDTAVSTAMDVPIVARFQSFDVDGGPPTYTRVAGPLNGTFSGFDPATGLFTYTPDSGYVGVDSITFRVNDGFADSDIGVVRINVTPSDCVCACWMDPECDSSLSAPDVSRTINIVFFNVLPSISLHCPTPDADFNCDCIIDVLDVAKVVSVVYFNDTDFCDPCVLDCTGQSR